MKHTLYFMAISLFVFASSANALTKDLELHCLKNANKDFRQWLMASSYKEFHAVDKRELRAKIDKAYKELSEALSSVDYSQCPGEIELMKQQLYTLSSEYLNQVAINKALAHSADNTFTEDESLSLDDKKAIQDELKAGIQSRNLLRRDIVLKIADYQVHLGQLSRERQIE